MKIRKKMSVQDNDQSFRTIPDDIIQEVIWSGDLQSFLMHDFNDIMAGNV